MKLALIFERFGPYHRARLEAASNVMNVLGIEIVRRDKTYAWSEVAETSTTPLARVAEDFSEPYAKIEERLVSILDRNRPTVLAVPGWFEPYSHSAIRWAGRTGARVIMMSDSNRYDSPRNALSERVKRAIIAHVSAGFVAGRDARDYIISLGIDSEQVTMGYDVVDNAHFDRPDLVPENGRRGFLAIGRFIARKNFSLLLDAYAQYCASHPTATWPLTIAGDGEELQALRVKVEKLGIQDKVTFTGFVDYSQLPALYASAAAFVIPSVIEQWGLVANEAMASGCAIIMSRACGAARDLLLPGFNGYEFEPTDTKALALYMHDLAANPDRTLQMGEAGRAIIQGYTIQSFAVALKKAAQLSCAAPVPTPSAMDRVLFETIANRSRKRAR